MIHIGFKPFMLSFVLSFTPITILAQQGGGGGGTPQGPRPCNPTTKQINFGCYTKSFSLPQAPHDFDYRQKCEDMSSGVCLYKSSDDIRFFECEDGTWGQRYSPTGDRSCQEIPVKISCNARVENSNVNLREIFTTSQLTLPIVNGQEMTSLSSFPEYSLINFECKADRNLSADHLNYSWDGLSGIPNCSSVSSGVCLEAKWEMWVSPNVKLALKSDEYQKVARVLLRNKSESNQEVSKDKFALKIKKSDTAPFAEIENGGRNEEIAIRAPSSKITISGAGTSGGACRIVSSGIISGPNANGVYQVQNGVLNFGAAIDGALGRASIIRSVDWRGVSSRVGLIGVLDGARPDSVSEVSAKVTTEAGGELSCSIKIRPIGQSYTVKMSKFGDCAFFSNLRSYYFKTNDGSAYRVEGFDPPLYFAGLKAKYGTKTPEVPFRGILNGAARVDGVIRIGVNGSVVVPPINERNYAQAVVVAKKFNPKTQAVSGAASFYGIINYNDYSITKLLPFGNEVRHNPTDTFVFQIYLAVKSMTTVNGNQVNIRGSTEAPYAVFLPFDTSNGTPMDRIVPMMADSCVPLFQITPPVIEGKPMPQALSSATACSYSRPFSFADIQSGRVALSVLHLVPETAQHQFPIDIVKAEAQEPCQASNTERQVACWDLKSSEFTMTNRRETHDACREITYETVQTVSEAPGVCIDNSNDNNTNSNGDSGD